MPSMAKGNSSSPNSYSARTPSHTQTPTFPANRDCSAFGRGEQHHEHLGSFVLTACSFISHLPVSADSVRFCCTAFHLLASRPAANLLNRFDLAHYNAASPLACIQEASSYIYPQEPGSGSGRRQWFTFSLSIGWKEKSRNTIKPFYVRRHHERMTCEKLYEHNIIHRARRNHSIFQLQATQHSTMTTYLQRTTQIQGCEVGRRRKNISHNICTHVSEKKNRLAKKICFLFPYLFKHSTVVASVYTYIHGSDGHCYDNDWVAFRLF